MNKFLSSTLLFLVAIPGRPAPAQAVSGLKADSSARYVVGQPGAAASASPVFRMEADEAEAAAPSPGWSVQNLPMHRVVLYRNGVSNFERRGKVTGNAEIQLRVPEFQVDGVMRSLLVLDLGQGRIGAVSRDMAETASANPNELPLAIPEGVGRNDATSGLLGILAQLQGVRVSLTSGGRTVTGVLLCVEQNTVQTKEETRVTQDGVKEIAESAEAKPLVQRYVAKLDVIEGKIDLLDKERKTLQTESAQLEKDLEAADKAVTMEKTLTPAQSAPAPQP